MVNVFNIDKNVGKIDNTKGLLVRNVFRTIQGEMPYAGRSALFVRLGGCNYGAKESCKFCDTDFSVDKSTYYTAKELLSLIRIQYDESPFELLVISGGEPLLQQAGLIELYEQLNTWFLVCNESPLIQFETNGTIPLTEKFVEALVTYMSVETVFVISPKPTPKGDFKLHLLNQFVNEDITNSYGYIRFVIGVDEPYNDLPEKIQHMILGQSWPVANIYLSPITVYTKEPVLEAEICVDFEATRANVRLAYNLSKKYGCRMSFQSHVYAGIE